MENYVGKICPFCKTEIREGEALKVCPACGIPHHESCWAENHGCTTFGCSQQHYEAQHTNPTDVCANCGAPLGDGQAFCPKCGTQKVVAKKAFCTQCGTELQDAQGFCPKCGTKAGGAATQSVNTTYSQPSYGQAYGQTSYSQLTTPEEPKKKKKVWPIILGVVAVVIIALVLLLKGPKVDSITVSQPSVEMRVGDSTSVSYTILPYKASDADVKWQSSNESVATVSSSGKITGKREGNCIITVTAGKKKAMISVEVIDMYPEEEQVLGTWYSIGYMDDDGDLHDLLASSSQFYAYRDFTGKTTVGSSEYDFIWEYTKYSDGYYYYTATLNDGGQFKFVMMELGGEDSVVVVLDSMMIVFQK